MASTNTFSGLRAMLKDSYSKKGPKAKAEEEASKNPEKFLKKTKNMSIKGLKGVAL